MKQKAVHIGLQTRPYGTRPRHMIFSPRRARDQNLPTFPRDRDETKTFGNYVSRLSRDRDIETETTSCHSPQTISAVGRGCCGLVAEKLYVEVGSDWQKICAVGQNTQKLVLMKLFNFIYVSGCI